MAALGDNPGPYANTPDPDGWLEHWRAAAPRNIDMGLTRVREVAAPLALHGLPVITGPAPTAKARPAPCWRPWPAGWLPPGVYSSPHLVHFEERCRVHGEIVLPMLTCCRISRPWSGRVGGTEVSLTYFRVHHAGHPAVG